MKRGCARETDKNTINIIHSGRSISRRVHCGSFNTAEGGIYSITKHVLQKSTILKENSSRSFSAKDHCIILKLPDGGQFKPHCKIIKS